MNKVIIALTILMLLAIVDASLWGFSVLTAPAMPSFPQQLAQLRADGHIDLLDKTVFAEVNATWWMNTTNGQDILLHFIGKSGSGLPPYFVKLPLTLNMTYVYCVPQLSNNLSINETMTLKFNPRVEAIMPDYFGMGLALRVYCSYDSFPHPGFGAPLLYVIIWYGDALKEGQYAKV